MGSPTHQNGDSAARIARLEAEVQLLKGVCYQLFANDVLLCDRANDLLSFLKESPSVDILRGLANRFDIMHWDVHGLGDIVKRRYMCPPDPSSGVALRD